MPGSTKTLHSNRHALASAIGAAVIAVSTGASAAEIEEVTVTAQMRAESLKDVPMAVSAFTGDTVKNSNLNDFKDLFALTPGVSGETSDSFFDSVSVRGVNNNSFGSGSDPALGVFLDGVYQSRAGATPSMYDLERVEVVKGRRAPCSVATPPPAPSPWSPANPATASPVKFPWAPASSVARTSRAAWICP
ncbi:TonB-dependent receptor plug domain-containing protein [Microbulbifer taiwanensis]|uniref:TonB-dependent receptor plug domain-containing protein n=1 Tax=Microbulbifer taiwanensis TaxID=986746 RepID=UPI00361265AC